MRSSGQDGLDVFERQGHLTSVDVVENEGQRLGRHPTQRDVPLAPLPHARGGQHHFEVIRAGGQNSPAEKKERRSSLL